MTERTPWVMTGRKFLLIMVAAFSVIIGVNLTLAYQAVATFPGLEVANSYVASQNFDRLKKAQLALGWQAEATIAQGQLRLSMRKDGLPISPEIFSAVIGRATNVAEDQFPTFVFDGTDYVAPITLGPGNWNLRLIALAEDGTKFQQRIIVGNQP